MSSAMARFLPSLVVASAVIFLAAGIPASVVRIPFLIALAVALFIMAVSETIQARSERRRVPDRRRHERTP